MNVINSLKSKLVSLKNAVVSKAKMLTVVSVAVFSGSTFAAGTPPDPSTFITAAMLESISSPILVTMGAVVTAAFGIMTFKLVVTVGMGVVKSFFGSAAR